MVQLTAAGDGVSSSSSPRLPPSLLQPHQNRRNQPLQNSKPLKTNPPKCAGHAFTFYFFLNIFNNMTPSTLLTLDNRMLA
jgi:hypothetical protein